MVRYIKKRKEKKRKDKKKDILRRGIRSWCLYSKGNSKRKNAPSTSSAGRGISFDVIRRGLLISHDYSPVIFLKGPKCVYKKEK
jgi:hypothetical protein